MSVRCFVTNKYYTYLGTLKVIPLLSIRVQCWEQKYESEMETETGGEPLENTAATFFPRASLAIIQFQLLTETTGIASIAYSYQFSL